MSSKDRTSTRLPPQDPAGRGPSRIGRYDVVRSLGSGATSTVYLAQDPLVGRQVAIKLLSAESRDAHAERFVREMNILAQVRHPNIVQIHDAGTFEGRPYSVMEHVAGGRLYETWIAVLVAPGTNPVGNESVAS